MKKQIIETEVVWEEDGQTKSMIYWGASPIDRTTAVVAVFMNHYGLGNYLDKNSDREAAEWSLEKDNFTVWRGKEISNLSFQ